MSFQHSLVVNTNSEPVVVIHGLTATPVSLKQFADDLAVRDFSTYIPLLSGHGAEPSSLLGSSHQVWLEEVRRTIHRAYEKHQKKVHLIGTSMGGNIALILAHELKDLVQSASVIGTPVDFKDGYWLKYTINIVKRFYKYHPKPEDQQKYYESLGVYPVWTGDAIHEMIKLIRKSQKILADVSVRTLVMQSLDDPVVLQSSARRIYNGLTSIPDEDKIEILLHHKSHVPIVGPTRQFATEIIIDFMQRRY